MNELFGLLNIFYEYFFVVADHLPSFVWLFATPWTAAHQVSLSLTISQSLPKFMSIALVMLSSYLILWHVIILLHSIFPSLRNFFQWIICSHQMTKILRVSASASVLPVSIQGWFPLGLTGLISLLSKGLTGVFSSTTIWRYHFFGALPSLRSSSHNRMWPQGKP